MLRRFVALFDRSLGSRNFEAGSPHKPGLCYILAFFSLASFPLCSVGQQRSDSDWDAEGQVAMNQYHDCARAKHAFLQESAVAQASPIWLDEVAHAAECSGDLAGALTYYDQELKKLPDTPRLVQKVGELRYKQEIQAEQDQARQVAALAAQRQQQQQAIQEAQDLSAAKARIDPDMQELARLLEADFKTSRTGTDSTGEFSDTTDHIRVVTHVTSIGHCTISFTEGQGKKQTSYTLDLAGKSAEIFEYNERFRLSYDRGQEVLINGFGLRPLVREDAWKVVNLINELGRACAPS